MKEGPGCSPGQQGLCSEPLEQWRGLALPHALPGVLVVCRAQGHSPELVWIVSLVHTARTVCVQLSVHRKQRPPSFWFVPFISTVRKVFGPQRLAEDTEILDFFCLFCFKILFILFAERGKGRRKRERVILRYRRNVSWLPLTHA